MLLSQVAEAPPAEPQVETPVIEPAAAVSTIEAEADSAVSPDAAVSPAPAEPAPTPTEEPAAAVAESTVAESVKELEAASTAGMTAGGRALNDPREAPRPVDVVEITTTHPTLFSDEVAPPAESSGRSVPRASNDPRGPLLEADLAQASG